MPLHSIDAARLTGRIRELGEIGRENRRGDAMRHGGYLWHCLADQGT